MALATGTASERSSGLSFSGQWTYLAPPASSPGGRQPVDSETCRLLFPWSDLGELRLKELPDEAAMVLVTLKDHWFVQLQGWWEPRVRVRRIQHEDQLTRPGEQTAMSPHRVVCLLAHR